MEPSATPPTIAGALTRFRQEGSWSSLVTAAGLVVTQGRLLEAARGAWDFARHRPGPLVPASPVETDRRLRQADLARTLLEARRSEALRMTTRHLGPEDAGLDCTLHAIIETDHGFVVGEYGEGSARLFVHHGSAMRVLTPYADDPRVRHIHSILRHGDVAYVTTGDAAKYLDRYRIVDGEPRFERRLKASLGGYTTCAVVAGRCWFGSDFSERPNHLWCLETGSRHYFPRPAFTKWCTLMVPLEDRYLVCLNQHLTVVSERQAISIFDTRTGRFVHCEEIEGPLPRSVHGVAGLGER